MVFLMKWSEKWREKWSEISSRAGGIPQTPFFHQGVALWGIPCGGHTEPSLWLGVFPRPLFHQGVALWGIPPNPVAGYACNRLILPNPLLP